MQLQEIAGYMRGHGRSWEVTGGCGRTGRSWEIAANLLLPNGPGAEGVPDTHVEAAAQSRRAGARAW